MSNFEILESASHPLKYLNYEIDPDWLTLLLERVGQGRIQKFNKIIFSGGIAVASTWKRVPLIINSLSQLQPGQKHGFIFGYFDPLKSEILVFPETIMAIAAQKSGLKSQELIKEFEKQFYPVLIEEIEHGFQNSKDTKYVSFLSKLVRFTSPLMFPFVLISVLFIVFTGKSYWWSLLVFLIWILWMFLPVWVAFLPKPRWWKRLTYKYSWAENDAKGKAISFKLYKMARKAIKFKLI